MVFLMGRVIVFDTMVFPTNLYETNASRQTQIGKHVSWLQQKTSADGTSRTNNVPSRRVSFTFRSSFYVCSFGFINYYVFLFFFI